jgi:hypothetical protein
MLYNDWAPPKGCIDTNKGTLALVALKMLGWILDFEVFFNGWAPF